MARIIPTIQTGKVKYAVYSTTGQWLGTFRCKSTAEEVSRQYNANPRLNLTVIG